MSKRCQHCGGKCAVISGDDWEATLMCLLCAREIVSAPGPRQLVFDVEIDQARRERNGIRKRGRKVGWSKLSNEDKEQVRMLYMQGVRQYEIAARFKVGLSTIYQVLKSESVPG